MIGWDEGLKEMVDCPSTGRGFQPGSPSAQPKRIGRGVRVAGLQFLHGEAQRRLDRFQLADLDRCVAIAKTTSPLIRPLKIGGDEMYAVFLHPFTVKAMRNDTATAGNWFDLQKAAIQGGVYKDNPIFTGALGVYNKCILYEATRVPNTVSADGTQTNFRRNLFCGAQAMAMAVGQDNKDREMNWEEELFDYGNQLGVAAGMIFGMKKTVFNSVDFSTIVISSYAPPVT